MLKINSLIHYTNGSETLYSGIIVKIGKIYIVVIDPKNEAEIELWNAGFKVGTCIQRNQIKDTHPVS